MAPQPGPGPRPGPGSAPRQPRFVRAAALGTFVFVCCGAAVSTGDTQRFAVLAIAVGLAWAVASVIGRQVRAVRLRDARRVVGAWIILSALADIFHLPPGDR